MKKVFISHSNIDRGAASELVSVLESSGISCWIAPRDISPGTSWPEAIATAIQETSAMILLLSQNTNESVQVIREVEHAVNQRKVLIPIRITDIEPSMAMNYFISTQQWLDAFPDGIGSITERLLDTLRSQMPDLIDPERKVEKSEKSKAPSSSDNSYSLEYNIKTLLRELIEQDGTDLLLTVGSAPCFRVKSVLERAQFDPLSPNDIRNLCLPFMRSAHKEKMEQERRVSFVFGIKGLSRFRANIFLQRGCWNAAITVIPYKITSMKTLRIANEYTDLLDFRRGMILVGGTSENLVLETIHSFINFFSHMRKMMVITVENPITFVQNHAKAAVQQIGIGSDTGSYHDAVMSSCNSKCDLIAIDELVDSSIASRLIDFSMNGICITSIAKSRAVSGDTLWNLREIIKKVQEDFTAKNIASTLHSIVTMDCTWNGKGEKIYLPEILVIDRDVRKLIEKGDISAIREVMRSTSKGMQVKNQAIAWNVKNGKLSLKEALNISNFPEELTTLLRTDLVPREAIPDIDGD